MNTQALVDLFRRYDVPLDTSAVRVLLDGGDEEQGRLLMEWAKSHITEDTLLTKDELNSYQFLERSGKATSLIASADLTQVQAVTDQELHDAIEELNRSTEVINKQTDALRQQQDAVSRLVSSSGMNDEARAAMEVKQLHKWGKDHNALATAVELQSQSLEYRFSELEQQNKAAGVDLTRVVSGVLHSDDKLLASLQQLGYELKSEDPEATASVTKLRETCARLIKYNVECIRTKLDRIFLETLEATRPTGASARVPLQEIAAQKNELEALYSEIIPVAQISVEQQWLQPSLHSLSRRNGISVNRSAEALEYVSHRRSSFVLTLYLISPIDKRQILNCMDYLLDHINRLLAHVYLRKEHEAATATMIATAKAELSTTVKVPTHRHRTLSSPARKLHAIPTDELTTPAPFRAGPHRRSSYENNLLEHLLGGLGLNPPPAEDAQTAPTQISILTDTLADRSIKSANVVRNVQFSFERAATIRLADARAAVQLLRDSVLAESPFAEIHLGDPGIEATIDVVAQEVHMLSKRLEGLERQAAMLTKGRNAKRDEMVERWGR